MATFTRLASTLTAKYFPSQTLTDAFYIDGRLFGKRETRQADITIDKEERGFFFSVFSHPKINGYEPGMMPPYEPQLRSTCNEVKFGRKEIDGMIQGFLSTAVDVTGKMKLQDNDDRAPYFSGIIVRDAEAFAVTIGSGLAFLYRDDTLFPLTDAGIPMEPIDTDGNRVSDFLYYCSSKTANALWSNFFTLSPDDCIILCNKEIYEALGQREILRILADAEDQCDAAGVIITQASARMPNVPMQFSISFVESVTSDEKKGLFGFKRKHKDEDMSDMSIQSTLEGGLVGAAAEAAADAGFTGGLQMAQSDVSETGLLMFGDSNDTVLPPATNQVASSDKFTEFASPVAPAASVEFLDPSITKAPTSEVSAEELMKSLLKESAAATAAPAATPVPTPAPAPAAEPASPFVANAINPFAASTTPSFGEESKDDSTEILMEPIASTEFKVEDDDMGETKPVAVLDGSILKSLAEAAAKPEEPKAEEPVIKPAVVEEESTVTTNKDGEILFSIGDEAGTFTAPESAATAAATAFDPYSMGSAEEMKNAAEFVFGDDGKMTLPTEEEMKSDVDSIPAPDFVIEATKPEIKEEDKLQVDFPEFSKPAEPETPVASAPVEEKKEEAQAPVEMPFTVPTEEPVVEEVPVEEIFELPFETAVGSFSDEKAPAAPQDEKTEILEDIPDMPLYNSNTFDTPVAAVNSEQPVNATNDDVYSYGQYVENENMDDMPAQYPVEEPPYQSFGNEGGSYQDYTQNPGYEQDYQYQPGQYQTEQVQPMQSQPAQATDDADGDNDWINAILGIDDSADAYGNYDAANTAPAAVNDGGAAMANNGYVYPNSGRPGGAPQQRRPGQGGSYRPQSAGSNGGRGGNGGRKMKLNRNGYIFLGFVIICLICLIILIAAIVKSCSKDDEVITESTVDPTVQTSDVAPVETTPAPAQTQDPSAPIGLFYFSDYTGYRNWIDLFKNVYGIDITDLNDSRITTILTYNGFDPATFNGPISGQAVYLPPIGVINGQIPVTYTFAGAPVADNNVVSGEPVVDDGTAEQAPVEGAAEGTPEEAPAV